MSNKRNFPDPSAFRVEIAQAKRACLDRPGDADRTCTFLVCLGQCTLAGTTVEVEAIPLGALSAGLDRAIERMMQATDDASNLRERLESVRRPEDLLPPILALIAARWDAWSVYIAIDDMTAGSPSVLDQAINRLLLATDQFDDALEANSDWLSLAWDDPAVAVLRTSLADEFAAAPPWWLGREHAMTAPIVSRAERWFPTEVMLAAASDDLPRARFLRWRSRIDMDLEAEFPIVLSPRADDFVLMLEVSRKGRPTAEFEGMSVELGGVLSVVSAQGEAPFRVGDLRRGTGLPDLVLGGDWDPVPEGEP